jgi:hypothetical protein
MELKLAGAWFPLSAVVIAFSSASRRWLLLFAAPFALSCPAAMLSVLVWTAAFGGGSEFP